MFIGKLDQLWITTSMLFQDNVAIHCKHKGIEYHIWFKPHPNLVPAEGEICTIYKHVNAKEVKKLYSHSAFGAGLLAAIRREARILGTMDEALDKIEEEKQQEKKKIIAESIASVKGQHGVKLYTVLKSVVEIIAPRDDLALQDSDIMRSAIELLSTIDEKIQDIQFELDKSAKGIS